MPEFGNRTSASEVVQGVSLSGKVALVTGASSGIGLATAEALASAGAQVILAVRNPQAAEACLARLGSLCHVLAMDLSDAGSVERGADWVIGHFGKLHILIGNAGVSKTPEAHLANGLDVRFATNHLGHFLLVHQLRGLLETARGRVVMISSAAHKGRPIRFDDLQWQIRPRDDLAAYGESKTANILFCIEATRRWPGNGVTFNAVLPGSALTGLQRYHGDELKRKIGFVGQDGVRNPALKTVEQAAATSVWAAIAGELDGVSGLVLEDCGEARVVGPETHPWSGFDASIADPADANRLWAESETILMSLGVLMSAA